MRLEPIEDSKEGDGVEDSLTDGVDNSLLKSTVEIIDVCDNFSAAVFIVVVAVVDDADGNDNHDDDNDNDDNNDSDDDDDDDDDDDEDDAMAVARLCRSVLRLITSSEFPAYDVARDGISWVGVSTDIVCEFDVSEKI